MPVQVNLEALALRTHGDVTVPAVQTALQEGNLENEG